MHFFTNGMFLFVYGIFFVHRRNFVVKHFFIFYPKRNRFIERVNEKLKCVIYVERERERERDRESISLYKREKCEDFLFNIKESIFIYLGDKPKYNYFNKKTFYVKIFLINRKLFKNHRSFINKNF